MKARFTRTRDGRYRVRLSPDERRLLGRLPDEAASLLDPGHRAAARLFPPAYPDDPTAEADYRALMGDELLAGHRQALEAMAKTVDAEVLDEEDLAAWMEAFEVLRLLLGTQLDVTEQDAPPPAGDPRAAPFALYHYLGLLQSDAVDALVAGLGHRPVDPPG